MKKGKLLSPIQPKTKEQLALEIKRENSRKLIKEQLYPALVAATKSVDEAGFLLQAASALIMEEAMNVLHEKKMEEIKKRMATKLCPDDERILQIEALLDTFDGLSLYEARMHFENLKAVIEQMKIEMFQGLTLDSFTPNWDKYLTR